MADDLGNQSRAGERQTRRNPEGSRRALLEAAIAEFASKGRAGARVDEIARRAGVNKQLVYHYFGNKDDLFRAALEEVYGQIRTRERALNLAKLPPTKAMERLVTFSFDYLLHHPEFIALLSDENRYGAFHLNGSPKVQSMHSPLVELIRESLDRGVREGVFRKDLDPIDLYISIAALSYFFFSNNRTLSAIFSKDLGSPKAVAVRRKHVVKFALSALRPDAT
ncbi:TetR/AcrR family transcriptional regulator [Microvirga massiliensis]|uniref:TetR/AcrR family transcriptional regulator n=1 Tax=Microvirga massiliensis TaxID=1033741 RepID=UPI00062BA70B|nr:TetR/AcrR family transcriptional regulator [Microvirga massiliensis]